MRPVVAKLSKAALWSAISLGIWLLTLSSLSWGELIVGTVCSLLVGVVAVITQRTVGARWAITANSMRPLLTVPFAIVTDTAQVLTLPFRRHGRLGRFETVDVDAAGPSPEATTRRAVATLATTVTPASIVVDVGGESGGMTIHALPTTGTHVEKGFLKK